MTPTSASLAENASTTAAIELSTITITDDGQGPNTLSLSGTDAASFEIVGNKLRLKAGVSLDFETKTSYSVRVNVDDTTVGSTPDAFADFTLTITDVVESTNLILNGSFENNGGVGQIYSGFTSLSNWTIGQSLGPSAEPYSFVANSSCDSYNSLPTVFTVGFGIPGLSFWGPNSGSNNGFGASPDGGFFYAGEGEFNRAALMQTISGLTVGSQYRLDFYYAGAQLTDSPGDTQQQWQIQFGNDLVLTPNMNVPSRGFTGWQSFSQTFTATSTSQTLSFLQSGTPGMYTMPLLDGVSLTA